MNENRLQFDLVMWFSNEYPELRGHLFEVYNNPANIKHALHRRGMGMIAGVSDLIFVVPDYAIIAGIEIKAPRSRHTKEHVKNQLEWGLKIIKTGGFYLIASNLQDCQGFIAALINKNTLKARKIEKQNLKYLQIQLKDNNKSVVF
jgi:hypothetical protein